MEKAEKTIRSLRDENNRLKMELSRITERTKDARLFHLLKETSALSRLGSWELDIVTNNFIFSDECSQIYNLSPGQNITFEDTLIFYAPASRKLLKRSVKNLIEKGTAFDLELEVVLEDDSKKWVRNRGRREVRDNVTVSIYGVIQDISSQKQLKKKLIQSEKLYHDLFETNQGIKLIIDPKNGKICDANRAALKFYGYSKSQLTNMVISDINGLSQCQEEIDLDLKNADGKKRFSYNLKHRLANGDIREVEVYTRPILIDEKAYLYSIIHDITKRRRSELMRDALLNISNALVGFKSLKDLLKAIQREISSFINSENFYVALYNPEDCSYSLPFFADKYEPDADFTAEEMKHSLTDYVRHTGKALLLDRTLDRKLQKSGDVELVGKESMIWMGVPFTTVAGVQGVVVIQNYESQTAYNNDDLKLMEFVADHIAHAIELKQNELQLIESEQRYRMLVNRSPLCIAVHQDGKIVFANPMAVKVLGVKDTASVIGLDVVKFIHPSSVEMVKKRHKLLTRGQDVPPIDEKFIRMDNRVIDVSVMGGPVLYNNKPAIQVVFFDITESKKNGEALSESEKSYRALFDNALEVIYVQDKNGIFLDVNKAAEKLYGHPHAYFIGKTPLDVALPDANDMDEVFTKFDMAYNGSPQSFEFWAVKKNGTPFLKEVRLAPSTYFGQRVVLAYARDITETKRREKVLKESEARFRSLVENSPLGIGVSRDEKILFANLSMATMFGYTQNELIGMHEMSLVADENVEMVHAYSRDRVLGKDVESTYEVKAIKKDGTVFPLRIRASMITLADGPAILAFLSDLTEMRKVEDERLQLEKQMLQAQKLESLGVLAGGIAHDFNNMLTGILGNTTLAMMEVPADCKARENLLKVEQISTRAAELCVQMLSYSGKGTVKMIPLNLNALIKEMVNLLNVSIPGKVKFTLNLDKDLPATDGDATRLRQIVMNLITNAADAIGNNEGLIRLTTGFGQFNADQLFSSYLDPVPTDIDYVFIEVNDNGSGMDDETLLRLFDPFFTTKFTGRGLGMAAVLGIIRSHHGSLKINSVPGNGTSIRIYFPASSKKFTESSLKQTSVEKVDKSSFILIVDDDKTIRDIVSQALSIIGYRVLTAGDGAEGVDVFMRHQKEIGLVILDMTMPKLNGLEVYEQLQLVNPDIKTIISSGYTVDEVATSINKNKNIIFLQKPFTVTELLTSITGMLQTDKVNSEK